MAEGVEYAFVSEDPVGEREFLDDVVQLIGHNFPLLSRFCEWRRQISAKSLRRQLAQIKGANGPIKPLQIKVAERFQAGDRFGGDPNSAVDHDLPIGGLGAQPRTRIHRSGGVLPSSGARSGIRTLKPAGRGGKFR
jgi:hypothetical protein